VVVVKMWGYSFLERFLMPNGSLVDSCIKERSLGKKGQETREQDTRIQDSRIQWKGLCSGIQFDGDARQYFSYLLPSSIKEMRKDSKSALP